MASIRMIHHVTLVVSDLEEACRFYEEEFGLEPLPAFQFDFPAQFYRINEQQQLHLTQWEDEYSFRGHVCFVVDDFDSLFYRMKEQKRIDIRPWGRVRRLPDGSLQMFVRDPAGNLLEISAPPSVSIDPEILADEELVERDPGTYASSRREYGGFKREDATLYPGQNATGKA